MNKDFLIAIVSSEKTWGNFSKFGMDEKIREQRKNFDLAVVLNGENQEAINFYSTYEPNYFIVRENLGFDPASIATVIQKIPTHRHTLIMHDDHWFLEDDWFERVKFYAKNFPQIDIFGNILYMIEHPLFENYCKEHNLEFLEPPSSKGFLHGISGIYSANAINKLKNFSFLPNLDTTEKNIANVEERVYSAIFHYLNLHVSGFNEPIYTFFRHSVRNLLNSLFSEGNYFYYWDNYEMAISRFLEYLRFAKLLNFTNDLLLPIINIAQSYLMLNDLQKAKEFYLWAKKLEPNVSFHENVYEKIPELRN